MMEETARRVKRFLQKSAITLNACERRLTPEFLYEQVFFFFHLGLVKHCETLPTDLTYEPVLKL
jgi:hypothetical protein